MSANLLFRRGKRVLIGFAVVVLALALNPVAGLGAETIKIGVIDDFSGPASAAFGQPALLGWRMAVEEVNNSGGLNGRQMEIVVRDDQFSEEKSAALVEHLIVKDGVQFLGGTSSSACALAVSAAAKAHKKLFMVHVSRSESITGAKGHRYVFRAAPNTIIEGRAGARYAMHKKYRKWFIVGEDYEYGRSIAENFWQELSRLVPSAEKVGEAWVPLKTQDYSACIKKIMATDASAVCGAFGASGMTRFVTQAEEAGVLKKTHIFMNAMADPVLVAGLSGVNLSDRVFGSATYLWFYPPTKANTEFVAKYDRYMQGQGKTAPDPPGGSVFGGYCSARFLLEAIRKAGTFETEKVIDALEGMTIDTPIGPIVMRACDHQALAPTYWGRIQTPKTFRAPILMNPYDIDPGNLLPKCEEVLGQRK